MARHFENHVAFVARFLECVWPFLSAYAQQVFKVLNKNTFWCFFCSLCTCSAQWSGVVIVNFEQVFVSWNEGILPKLYFFK